MSDILPNLVSDPAMEAFREADRELLAEIQGHERCLDVARAKRDLISELIERLNKKSKKPRRTIERPAPPPAVPAPEPETRLSDAPVNDAPAPRGVFAPVSPIPAETDPEAA